MSYFGTPERDPSHAMLLNGGGGYPLMGGGCFAMAWEPPPPPRKCELVAALRCVCSEIGGPRTEKFLFLLHLHYPGESSLDQCNVPLKQFSRCGLCAECGLCEGMLLV